MVMVARGSQAIAGETFWSQSQQGGRIPSRLGNYCLYCDKAATLLFTDNETNNERLFGTPNTNFYLEDGVNNYLVEGRQDAVDPTSKEPRLLSTIKPRSLPVRRRYFVCG